jgi:hypothetical protein
MYRRTETSAERSPFIANRKYGLLVSNNHSDFSMGKANKIKDLLKSKFPNRGTSATRYRDFSEQSYDVLNEHKYGRNMHRLHQAPCVPQVTLASRVNPSLMEKSNYHKFQEQVKAMKARRGESTEYQNTSQTV